jgi:lipopolysaccharide transport system ATP-binding protein
MAPVNNQATRFAETNQTSPTLLHVTHWKAGSQWVYAVLRALFPDRIVPPLVGDYQVRHWPIQPGRVYPTVYSTREELERHSMPPDTLRFVVLRDLRDTLISWYFSFKQSHAVMTARMAKYRDLLGRMSVEDGLLAMIEYQLEPAAEIQLSWADGPDPIIKYEALLDDDYGVLKRLLVDQLALRVSDDALRRAVDACRFEKLSGGRIAGTADPNSHYRKGVAGDWRNYFTPRVTEAFKARFGDVLVATGYERDLNW